MVAACIEFSDLPELVIGVDDGATLVTLDGGKVLLVVVEGAGSRVAVPSTNSSRPVTDKEVGTTYIWKACDTVRPSAGFGGRVIAAPARLFNGSGEPPMKRRELGTSTEYGTAVFSRKIAPVLLVESFIVA